MPSSLKAPWSGDVTQWIRTVWQPWTNWMGQLGLVNINVGATAAPQVEQHIVSDVASYGSQIGRIADALEVLVAQQLADPSRLSVEQIGKFTAFLDQLRDVRTAKRRARAASAG